MLAIRGKDKHGGDVRVAVLASNIVSVEQNPQGLSIIMKEGFAAIHFVQVSETTFDEIVQAVDLAQSQGTP